MLAVFHGTHSFRLVCISEWKLFPIYRLYGFCGCCNQSTQTCWVKRTEVYSLIGMEYRRAEIQVDRFWACSTGPIGENPHLVDNHFICQCQFLVFIMHTFIFIYLQGFHKFFCMFNMYLSIIMMWESIIVWSLFAS